MKTPSTARRELGRAERAVYELIRIGHLTSHMAPLYRREISALAAAGLVTRTPDGGFEAPFVLVDGRPASVPPPAPPPPPPPKLVNLNIRVPAEVLEALDLLGGNRSDVVRTVLARELPRMLEAQTAPTAAPRPGSGTRRLAETGT